MFFRHLAQTSTDPLALEVVLAEGCYLQDLRGKRFLDMVGGISVANVGHRHPAVVDAIRKQLDAYLHVMVYGEFIESPQVKFATALTALLPAHLDSVYFTNSGAEAIEGAMKLAKRINGRHRILAFTNSYHGSTQGALSILGDEHWRNAFRPLLPGITHVDYNSEAALEQVDENLCCVILETVQGEAGVIAPGNKWIQAIAEKCKEKGVLLVLDEVQAGFGRTGKRWAFEHFGIEPDILVLGKALGGGLPLGAFISSKDKMDLLSENPVLGHITTFGGHPLSCAAGLAALEVLENENLISQVKEKEELLRELLVHPQIKEVRNFGLWFAVQFESGEKNKEVIARCLENSVFTDWFLFTSSCMRLSPPLTITADEIKRAAGIIVEAIG